MRKLGSFLDQILVSGGNFLTVVICAHALPLSEQGKLTYVFASYMALLLLNVAGIFQGAAVRAPAQERASYQISLARLQLLQAILLSMLVSEIWFGAGSVFGWQATSTEAGLLLAFLVMQQLADFDRRAAYVFSSTKRAIVSSAAIYPVRILGLLIIRPDTVNQVLEILILSSILPAAFTVFSACQSIRANALSCFNTIKVHLAYSWLFIVGAPLGWLCAYIPIFMLGIMHGKEQAALLVSIRGISNMANVLMEQIETKVVADWARMWHGEDASVLEASMSRTLKMGIIVWSVGMAVILVSGREIVNLVLGSLYAPHWNLLVIGWLGYGVYFIARILGIKNRISNNTKIELMGTIFGIVTAVLTGIMLIPALSALGAAWVYVAIPVVMLGCQIYFKKRLVR